MEIVKGWFEGMDGGADTVSLGVSLADMYRGGQAGVGMTIDIMLARCFANAENTDEFRRHLDYVISQLQVVQRNVNQEK